MKIRQLITRRNKRCWGLVFLLLSAICRPASAAFLERVQVEAVSSSGKSLILNSGHLKGLRLGDHAQVLRVSGPADRPQLKSVGLAEVIRVTPRESYWFLHDQNRAHSVKAGAQVSLMRRSQALQGLREQNVLQRKVVLSSGQKIEDELEERLRGMPDGLVSERRKKYNSRQLNVKDRDKTTYDLETSQYDVWSKKRRPDFMEQAMREFEVDYIGQLEDVSGAEKVRRENSHKVFQSYVNNVIETLNSRPGGLSELYQRDMDKSYKNYVGDVLVKRNLYSQVTEPEEERIGLKPHALEKMKRDGPLWSADLDDRQLREFMVKTGLVEEVQRRDRALNRVLGHEVLLRASTGLVKHTNADDPNFQNVNYSLSAAYEYALKRASDFLSSWTIEAEVFTGINFYEMAPELNGRFQESGFGASANYYFYNSPDTIDKLIFYAGLGLRRSSATGGSKILEGQQSYNYQVLSLPLYQLGAKYRFRAGDSYKNDLKIGMGLNFLLSFESKNLSVIGEDELDSPVYSSFDIQDTRLAVGLSLYF